MTASLISLVVGIVVAVTAASRRMFAKVYGPMIRAQRAFHERQPLAMHWSEAFYIKFLRLIMLGSCLVLVGLGLTGLVVS